MPSRSRRSSASCLASSWIPSAARQARTAWSSNATGAPNTAMMPSPVNLSTVPPKCCTTAAARVTSSAMTSRSRSAPSKVAMSIECTTSANRTVTCLYSAGVGDSATGAPQPWQNRAFARGSVPHVRHAITAVIRPRIGPGFDEYVRIASRALLAISLMLCGPRRRMLASMSETDWSDVSVSELPTGLPTGTVTLVLADVEGSTRLWDTQPDEMAAAVARLDQALADITAAHRGVRPVEQGEGDSFVIAFARASDAVACALELQRAPLAPIRLRIGIHT